MRVLLLAEHVRGTDGWSRYARDLARALEDEGHTVAAAVCEADATFELEQFTFLSRPLSYIGRPYRAYRSGAALARIVREWKPDIVHVAVEPYAAICLFLPRHIPVSMTAHGTYAVIPHLLRPSLRRVLAAGIKRHVHAQVTGIVSVSEYTKAHMLRHAGRARDMLDAKTVVIPNGVHFVKEPKRSGEAHPFRVLFVGAIKPRKGVREAIAAFAHFVHTYDQEAEFHIVGSFSDTDPYVREAMQSARDLGVDSRITWTGRIEDSALSREYAKADAFILLPVPDKKWFEGFGLVYLEANAHGVPVVGARGSGAEEAVKDGVSGFLVDAADANAAAEALRKVREGGYTLSESARTWAKAHDWSVIGKRYSGWLSSLVPHQGRL